MYDSKLILLLRSLNRNEFRQLGRFLNSPFFNSNEDVIRLYEYLRKNNHYPNFDSSVLTKEYVDKKIFFDKEEIYSFQPRRILDCMSNLSLLIISFMATLESQNEADLIKDQLVLKSFSRRNLHGLFDHKTKDAIEKLETRSFRDIHFYKTMFELQQAYFFHPDTSKLKLSTDKISAIMENLDLFYALTKLRMSCEIRFREEILSEHYEIDLIQEVIKISSEKYVFNNLLFTIYIKLISLFSNSYEESVYQEVKSIYFENLQVIGKEEQKIILHYLVNIASIAVNTQINSVREIFDLYKAGLQYEILIMNDRITLESFSNIAILGSKLKEFDWTYDFILTYEKHLDESIRADTKLISMAYWHFNQQQFDETLQLIDEQEVPGKAFHIRTRALLVRTYLEKFLIDSNFFSLLSSNAESFRKQLERSNLISDNRKTAYKYFIKYTTQIARLVYTRPATFDKRLKRIKSSIQNNNAVIARSWLLDKVESLEES